MTSGLLRFTVVNEYKILTLPWQKNQGHSYRIR